MTKYLTNKEVGEMFDEKAKSLFTSGGISVLLDYPPHEQVLDEMSVKSFISQIRQSDLQAIKEFVEWKEREDFNPDGIGVVKHDYTLYNQALSDISSYIDSLLEDK